MKKLLALLLILVMSIGVLVACKPDQPEGPTLDQAKEYLNGIMKDGNGKATPNDYDVVGKVIIDGTSFEVTWTTNKENITVKASSKANLWTIDVPEVNAEELTYEITATIKNAAGESVQVTFNKILPVLDSTGVVTAPVEGTNYKLFLEQVNLGYTLYAKAESQDGQNKYILTTLDPKEAADFQVEVVDGGYKIFTMINGVKNYVHAKGVDNNGKVSKYIGFATESDVVYKYNADINTFVVDIDGIKYGVGTYNAFETISISETTYFNSGNINVEGGQFPVGFMLSSYAETLTPDEKPVVSDPTPDTTLTVKEAIDLGNTKLKDQYTEGKYYVTGVITEVYNDQYGNMYITDGNGNTLCIYGTYSADGSTSYQNLTVKPVAGDTITVYGIIGKFNDPQMKNGWITAHTPGEGGNTPGEGGGENPDPTPDPEGQIVFEFGANGNAAHNDGSKIEGGTKTYTSGNYQLVLTNVDSVYADAFDAKGNSILKFGTSSVAGTITFVVPDDVVSVVINAARYKNYDDNNIIVINGTEYTLTKNSNDGEYEAITVDTTTNKTVTVASSTSAGKPRCVVNSISYVLGEGGGQTPVECEHTYDNGVCTKCGEEDPNYVPPTVDPTVPVYNLVTSLNNGDKVVIGAPAYNKLLSMLKTGNYNVGIDYTTTDFSKVTNDEIFVVTVNDDGSYTFTSVSGKVLAMQDSYTSLNDTGANNKWEVTAKSGAAAGIFLVKNTVRGTYLEWYNQYSNWSTYSNASDSQFEISFYLVEAGEGGSEPPVECEHTYDNGVCTKCGEEDPDYVAPNPDVITTIAGALTAEVGAAAEITGTVSEFYQGWNTQFNNCSPYIVDGEGNRIIVFRCTVAVNVGDVISVVGVIGQYNSVNQIAEGSTVTVVTPHVCSTFTEADCLNAAKCTVCGKENGEAPGHNYANGVCTECGATEAVGSVTASKLIAELITELGWTNNTTKQQFSLDDNVTVKINGGSNTGKAYNGDHIRIYATDSPAGTITITVPTGYELVSVKITAEEGTYAFLQISGVDAQDICNATTAVSGSSVVINSVKNGSDGKQVRVTAIEVVYKSVDAEA